MGVGNAPRERDKQTDRQKETERGLKQNNYRLSHHFYNLLIDDDHDDERS